MVDPAGGSTCDAFSIGPCPSSFSFLVVRWLDGDGRACGWGCGLRVQAVGLGWEYASLRCDFLPESHRNSISSEDCRRETWSKSNSRCGTTESDCKAHPNTDSSLSGSSFRISGLALGLETNIGIGLAIDTGGLGRTRAAPRP